MPYAVAADGTRIAYAMRGTGARTVVFLHAWGASASYFEDTISSLNLTTMRAIAIDMRGHGDSDKPDVKLSWDLLAQDVFAVADDANAKTFVVVGHKMGGKLAQYLPIVEPSRIEGMVLIASPSAGKAETPDTVKAWVQLAGNGKAIVDTIVKPSLRGPVGNETLKRFARAAARIPRMYLERTLELADNTSFIKKLEDVSVPVLLISSGEDPTHAIERDIIESLPHATAEIMDAGVEIPIERPAEFARVLTEFVSDLA